jgi:hypothetical protein
MVTLPLSPNYLVRTKIRIRIAIAIPNGNASPSIAGAYWLNAEKRSQDVASK